jgi:hypothetical protein
MITKFHIFESKVEDKIVFYHATKSEHLPYIAEHGLTPNIDRKSNWSDGLAEHGKGKVFATKDLEQAKWYSGSVNKWKWNTERQRYEGPNSYPILRFFLDKKRHKDKNGWEEIRFVVDGNELKKDDQGFHSDYYSTKPIKSQLEISIDTEHKNWIKLTPELAKEISEKDTEYIKEGLTMSAPTKKVLKIFRRKFPNYYFGLKSGGEQSEIEITSGREETVSRITEIEELCNVLGWFISHGDGKRDGKNGEPGEYYIYDKNFNEHTYDEVIIKPKYDPKEISGKPSVMYHVTPRRNVDKILKIGLIPKHKDKQAYHPDRVYLTDEPELAWGLKNEFERIDGWKCEILKIMTKNLNIKLYSDVDARNNGFYTLENIPPQFISILPESEYKKHWSWN